MLDCLQAFPTFLPALSSFFIADISTHKYVVSLTDRPIFDKLMLLSDLIISSEKISSCLLNLAFLFMYWGLLIFNLIAYISVINHSLLIRFMSEQSSYI